MKASAYLVYLVVLLAAVGAENGRAQSGTFSNVTANVVPGLPGSLPGIKYGSVAWGDYDNDGRLDFLLTGLAEIYHEVSQVWWNTGSGFSNVTASVAPSLPGVSDSSVAWGDYDNDGRLDFLITGGTLTGTVSQVWRNMGSGFSNVTASVAPGLPGVSRGSVAWGDYDNDGRLDFLITGRGISQLWRNTSSGFSNVTASVAPGLPGVDYSSVAWGDYDNDGRLDFLLTGAPTLGTGLSQLWRNTGSGFSNVTANVAPGLTAINSGSVAWGDYDQDGRLDFLVTGGVFAPQVSQVWQNTGSGFSNVTANVAPGLTAINSGSVAWGDCDHDGRLDFLITGYKHSGPGISRLWQNTGSGFSNVTASIAPGLANVHVSSVAWGDYDNDGRLDFLITGSSNGTYFVSQLWRNNLSLSNAPPAAPAGLAAIISGNTAALNWNAPLDDLTPAAGLNYNLRIGSAPGASDVLAPMASTNGLRLLPTLGNAQTATNKVYRLAPGRTYYWSVQALDPSFAGSPFAVEQQFTIAPLLVNPVRLANGEFEFSFTNQSVLSFDVLVSTNGALPLTNWINLGPAIPLGGGLYRFTDASGTGEVQRYYLLRSQ